MAAKLKNKMKHITVIGAGTMGSGIAHVFAQYGFNVVLNDISKSALDKALNSITKNLDRMVEKTKITADTKEVTLKNVSLSVDFKDAVSRADLVIEAATENEAIKLKIFTDLDQICPPYTILSSNTSSISITKIASVTKRPDKVIGMHFMNPAPIMKLVEIIRGYNTSDLICETIMDLTKSLDKVPVEVNDFPGFISNRVLIPMINESINCLFEGVAGVEEVDTVMKLGMAHPMGPLQLADFIGLDVVLAILRVLEDGFGNPKYAPCPLLVKMVTAGKLGVKTGEGFYIYTQGSKELVVAPKFSRFPETLSNLSNLS